MTTDTQTMPALDLSQLFAPNADADTTAEMMREVNKYALQLRPDQIRSLQAMDYLVRLLDKKGKTEKADVYREMAKDYLNYKIYQGSDIFVLKAVEHYSLKRFMDKLNINVNKA